MLLAFGLSFVSAAIAHVGGGIAFVLYRDPCPFFSYFVVSIMGGSQLMGRLPEEFSC